MRCWLLLRPWRISVSTVEMIRPARPPRGKPGTPPPSGPKSCPINPANTGGRGDDPTRPDPAVQARDVVVVEIEILADQLGQHVVRGLDRLVIEQPVGLLDRSQCLQRVGRNPRQHPLALGLQAPLTVGLLAR